jgi:hypothetical protein
VSVACPNDRYEEVSRSRPHHKHAKNQKCDSFPAAPVTRWRFDFGRHKIARKVNWAGLTEIQRSGRSGLPVCRTVSSGLQVYSQSG